MKERGLRSVELQTCEHKVEQTQDAHQSATALWFLIVVLFLIIGTGSSL